MNVGSSSFNGHMRELRSLHPTPTSDAALGSYLCYLINMQPGYNQFQAIVALKQVKAA